MWASLNLSDNPVMRGRVHTRTMLKGLVADLRIKLNYCKLVNFIQVSQVP